MSEQEPVELCIYHKKDDNSPYINIANFISSDELPKWKNSENATLLEFDIVLQRPEYNDGTPIKIESGSEICITENETNQSLLNSMSGKVLRYNISDIRYDLSDSDNPKPNNQINITVRQTDFSINIIQITKTDPVLFSELIKEILFKNTRDDLGGVLPDGTIIEKFKLLDTDLTLASFEGKGSAKDLLTQACDQLSYKWQLQYYCQKDVTNTIKVIQQILISKD